MESLQPKGIWQLTVRSDFSSSHCLRNYGGKCESVHGHNFGVAVTVEGETLSDDVHILLDFSVLKRELKDVLEELDHKHLNDVPPFDELNPSSENLARFIHHRMAERVESYGVRMAETTVSEKAAQSATYRTIQR